MAALATDRNAYFTYEPSSRLSGTVRRNEARWNEADDRRGRGRRRRWCVRRTRLELGFGLSERTGGWITKHPLFLRFNAIDRVLSCARFRSRDVSVRPRTKSLILHTFSAMINRIAAFSCIRRSFYSLYFIKNVHLSYFRVLFFLIHFRKYMSKVRLPKLRKLYLLVELFIGKSVIEIGGSF